LPGIARIGDVLHQVGFLAGDGGGRLHVVVTLGEQVVAFIAVLCVKGAVKMPAAEPFAL
jgi:hypothetical protein